MSSLSSHPPVGLFLPILLPTFVAKAMPLSLQPHSPLSPQRAPHLYEG